MFGAGAGGLLGSILGRIFGGISSSGIEGIVEGTFLI